MWHIVVEFRYNMTNLAHKIVEKTSKKALTLVAIVSIIALSLIKT
jgi:hypothetical protein